ncbi:MAG: dTDP-glucose 4,6-dehydratase [Patescibacteria group bacterium]|nr:dTDP-glucose 4,6-dehydratase [Patescibacteria group bacterium]
MKYKKKILVTGGAGFIGSNYLNKYVAQYPNYFFINADTLTYAANPRNIKIKGKKNYIFKKADIRNLFLLEKIFEYFKPTDVIHFAAESHVDFSIANPGIFVETNVNGTNNLLLLSKKYEIDRFHQISTDEVYGSLDSKDKPFTRNSPLKPNSPYSASKASADLLVRAYNKTFGLNTVITRCSNNYGPRQDKSKLIPKFINNLLSGKKVPLYSKGENIRDWIYVEDHIDAIDLVFHKGKTGEIYNIGGDCELTNMGITKKILKLMGRDESFIESVTDRLGHDFRYAIDNTETSSELGWKPKINFDDGIKMTLEYYRGRI